MKVFMVRGVPLAMQRDGWWLASPPVSATGHSRTQRQPWIAPLALVGLLALGDVLLWDVLPGLALAVFGIALVVAAALVLYPRTAPPRLAWISMATLFSVLPLVELVQPLSILIAAVGLSATLTLLAGVPLKRVAPGAFRLWYFGPVQTGVDLWQRVSRVQAPRTDISEWKRAFVGWALPAGFGAAFLILFAQANPVLSDLLRDAMPRRFYFPEVGRVALWVLLALVAWPCLILWRLGERLRQDPKAQRTPMALPIVNSQSITRSLVLFNGMFAVQTLMDVAFLYGGALPEGMSYATYAHRGAYPLLCTALLAGVFALIARPFAKDMPLVRTLLLVWIVQTLALVLASVIRLDTYVDIYGLTRLRIAAFIWMGVVAAGLCITWMQIWQDRSGGWLLLRCSALGVAVLYGCAFTSFDRVIARHNLTHEVRLDQRYLCGLGEAASPMIARYAQIPVARFCAVTGTMPRVTQPADWREWGFRNWRVRRSLVAMTSEIAKP